MYLKKKSKMIYSCTLLLLVDVFFFKRRKKENCLLNPAPNEAFPLAVQLKNVCDSIQNRMWCHKMQHYKSHDLATQKEWFACVAYTTSMLRLAHRVVLDVTVSMIQRKTVKFFSEIMPYAFEFWLFTFGGKNTSVTANQE